MSSSSSTVGTQGTKLEQVQARIYEIQGWVFSKFPQIPWSRLDVKKLRLGYHFVSFACVCFFFTGIYGHFKPETPYHEGQSLLCAFLLMVYVMSYFYSPRKVEIISGLYTTILSLDKWVTFRCLKCAVSIILYSVGIEKYPYLFSVCSCSFSGVSLSMVKFYGENFDSYGLCEDFIVALFVPCCDNFAKFSLHYFFNLSVVKKYVQCTLFESYGKRYIYFLIFLAALCFAVFTRYSPELNQNKGKSAAEETEEKNDLSNEILSLRAKLDSMDNEFTARWNSMNEETETLRVTILDLKIEIQSLEMNKTVVQRELRSLQAKKDTVVQYLQERMKALVQTHEETGKQIIEITGSLLAIASSSSSSGALNENSLLELEGEHPEEEGRLEEEEGRLALEALVLLRGGIQDLCFVQGGIQDLC